MPLGVFIAVAVLGMDFLVFVLFQWTYGDKRRTVMRRVAEQRRALEQPHHRPFLVSQHPRGPRTQARLQKVRARMGMRVA